MTKVITREILGKEFQITIADSNIIDGVDFHYQTQDDRIFGSSFMWGAPMEDVDEEDLEAIIDYVERDLKNRRDITLEQKYVIKSIK